MKKYLQFLASFLLISLVLYLFQGPLIFAYQSLLLLAISLVRGAELTYYYDSSFRLIVILALLLATPGVAIKRRLLFCLYGLLSLWAIDLVSFAVWTTPPPLTPGRLVSQAHMVYSLIWRMAGHWVVPFLLWVIMNKQQLAGWVAEKSSKAGKQG